jgi:hypothetical protein
MINTCHYLNIDQLVAEYSPTHQQILYKYDLHNSRNFVADQESYCVNTRGHITQKVNHFKHAFFFLMWKPCEILFHSLIYELTAAPELQSINIYRLRIHPGLCSGAGIYSWPDYLDTHNLFHRHFHHCPYLKSFRSTWDSSWHIRPSGRSLHLPISGYMASAIS